MVPVYGNSVIPVKGIRPMRRKTRALGTVRPVPQPIPPPPNYRFEIVEAEIRRAVKAVEKKTGNGLKALAEDIGWKYQDLIRALKRSEETNKKTGKKTRRLFLDVEAIGRIAAWVAEKTGESLPPGWPLQSEADYKRNMRLIRDSIERRDRTPHGSA